MNVALSTSERRQLAALVDRIIPRDAFPSATEAGFFEFIACNAESLSALVDALRPGLARLEQHQFADAAIFDQDTMLHTLEAEQEMRRFVTMATTLATQSYYSDEANGGNAGHRSWQMIGFDPAPKRAFVPLPEPSLVATPFEALVAEYDAIVVGAGAGGGIVACELAEAGWSVLLLERGDAFATEQVSADHLRNHRFPVYGHNTGPDLDGHPRVIVRGDRAELRRPHEVGWHNNAMTVGGGTRVWGGQAWRFAPQDFRMATIHGVPEGSSLADWPFDYSTLAPFYARAEREIGVCGQRGHRYEGAREDYPMPPLPATREARMLGEAAALLGWTTRPVPLAINSVEYQGRQACAGCAQCVGFACPSGSKNGSHNTVIPRALATGRCTLTTRAFVGNVLTDDLGQARGVEAYFDGAKPQVRRLHAHTVVLSAGAIETARLLLMSRSPTHPNGLGNRFDQVGRALQGHLYAGASGLADEDIQECVGPGVTIATCEFNHGNPGIIGGGLLANEFVPLPVHYWSTFYPTTLPRRGTAGKRAFAEAYRRRLVAMGPVQEIPIPNARVTLDPQVTDKFGLPVARLSGGVHPESVKAAQMLERRAHEWLSAAGARDLTTFAPRSTDVLSGGQHQAGTCRMGEDPVRSVTDPNGRVHGQRHLWIADASLHPTNGGYNPGLTVMANAYRVAAAILVHDFR